MLHSTGNASQLLVSQEYLPAYVPTSKVQTESINALPNLFLSSITVGLWHPPLVLLSKSFIDISALSNVEFCSLLNWLWPWPTSCISQNLTMAVRPRDLLLEHGCSHCHTPPIQRLNGICLLAEVNESLNAYYYCVGLFFIRAINISNFPTCTTVWWTWPLKRTV